MVNEDTEFFFPERYLYSYAAYTSSEHRGRGLAQSRWTYYCRWREEREEKGVDRPTIYYIELTNLNSMASGSGYDHVVIGYAGYLGYGQRLWYGSTKGCRNAGAGFRKKALDAKTI